MWQAETLKAVACNAVIGRQHIGYGLCMLICTHQHSLLRAQMLDQQYLAVATYSTGKFAPKLMALLPIQEVQDEYGAQVRFSLTLTIQLSQDPVCLCPAVNAAWSCEQPIVQPGGFVSAVFVYLLSIVHSTHSFVFGAASGHRQSVAPRVHSRGRRMCCYCYCVAPVSKMLRPSSTLSRRKMKQHAPGCHAAGAACAFSCSRSACGSCGVEPSAARLENPAKTLKIRCQLPRSWSRRGCRWCSCHSRTTSGRRRTTRCSWGRATLWRMLMPSTRRPT